MTRSTAVSRQETIAGNMDTSLLKALALVFMLIDHMGAVIFPYATEMRVIGRIAFPLYAWCLVVGSIKTKDPWKYGLRLLGLALISQPLYMMALRHSWTDFGILFTLLIGLIAIRGIRAHFFGSEIWVPALCYLLLGFIKVDYGWKGLTFILVLYGARQNRSGLIAAFLAYALYWGASSGTVTDFFGINFGFLQWPGIGTVLQAFFHLQTLCWLALPLIVIQTNSKLRMPKWLGYGLYPIHLIVLIIMQLTFGGATFSALTQGF